MEKTLVVMAAGMGSRYGGLKQLDSIGPSGETIIDYSIYDAWKSGFTKVIFIIRKDIESDFRKKIGNKYAGKMDVRYVFQELDDLPDGFFPPSGRSKPWGTGHAMLTAGKEINDSFLIINADDLYGREGFRAAGEYLGSMSPEKPGAAMVGYYLKNTLSGNGTVARGVCMADGNDCLTHVTEVQGIYRDKSGEILSEGGKKLDDERIVSMNIWMFSPAVLSYAKYLFTEFLNSNMDNPKSEFFIPTVVQSLITERDARVPVLRTAAKWYGVTYREDKAEVVEMIKKAVDNGTYPGRLWE